MNVLTPNARKGEKSLAGDAHLASPLADKLNMILVWFMLNNFRVEMLFTDACTEFYEELVCDLHTKYYRH